MWSRIINVVLIIQIPGGKDFALRYEVAPSDVLHGETIRETGEITIRFGELAITAGLDAHDKHTKN